MTSRTDTPDPALRHTEQRLREHLERAQADRGRRGSHLVTGYDSLDRPVHEPAWLVHEHILMFGLANQYRADRALPAVSWREFRLVPDARDGRVDSSDRLVEALARMVHGVPWREVSPAEPGMRDDRRATPGGLVAHRRRDVRLLLFVAAAVLAVAGVLAVAAALAR